MPQQIPKDLLAKIKKLSNNLDGRVDDLIAAIENYQTRYENLLLKQKLDMDGVKLARTAKNYSLISALSPVDSLNYEKIVSQYIDEYNAVAKEQMAFLKELGIATGVVFTDITIVKRLQKVDFDALYGQGQQLDAAIKKQMVNAIALGSPFRDAVDNLSRELLGSGDKAGSLSRYAETYMRTSMFGLSRSIDKEVYDNVGYKKFLYYGPDDNKTREFCQEHVGNEYTESEIEQFPDENGSGLDPWFSPGGWNCRHRLIAVA